MTFTSFSNVGTSTTRRVAASLVTSLAVALLIAAVLFAQWMGMRHRIEHANRADDGAATMLGSASTSGAVSDEDRGHQHSCALFDGTVSADTVAIAPLVLPLPICAGTLALWLAFTSWDAPHTHFFSSRAPPA